ncbi:MAG: Gldg family protein [Puniceicoccales bacterium]|nr:Gldg family protein [Puniceicoccales bacterium]
MASFRSSNRTKILCSSLIISLIIVIYGLVNALSSKYFYRKAFWEKSGLVLNEESKKVLSNLKSDVEIFVLLEKNQEYADVFNLVKNDIRHLMSEYVDSTNESRIEVEFINVIENSKGYSNLCGRFGILPTNCVIIATNNKTKVLAIDEFYRTHRGSVIAFCGEQVVTSSLKELSSTDNNVLYFLVGHGEYELENVSLSKGLSALEHAAKQKNCEVRSLNLYDTKAIPQDADLVIVVGAKSKFLGFEREILRDFVDNRDGKLVFALDGNFDIGLKEFFDDYGIFVGDNMLISTNETTSSYLEDLIIKRFGHHRINGKLIEFRVPVVFGATHEVKQAPWFVDNEKFEITELMQTDDGVREQGEVGNDNSAGPHIIATISERKKFDTSEITTKAGKILVIGNADFIANGKFKILGNRVFWFSISDYMLYGNSLENFEDVKIEKYRLVLSRKALAQIMTRLAILPMFFALMGIIIAWRRRK